MKKYDSMIIGHVTTDRNTDHLGNTVCAPGGAVLPVEFLISIKAVKRNRFASAAQNELMMNLLSMGAIDREQAISLMTFEGKEQVLKHIREAEAEPLFPERMKKKRFGGNL